MPTGWSTCRSFPICSRTRPVRSEMVYLLVRLDKEYTKEAPAEPWPSYYAPRMLEYFAGPRDPT